MKRFILCFSLMLSGCAANPPEALLNLKGSTQAIIVHPLRAHATRAVLSAWEKNREWRRKYLASAVIGRNGLAADGQKKEGDGKTPFGIYTIGPAFGYAPTFKTGLDYRQATDADFWVDDPNSLQYNHWVTGAPEAASYEHLKRPDDLYRFAVVIGYNRDPVVKGAGSAIFMHIWRGYDRATAGCVALNARNLRKILHWLNRQDNPVIIME